MSEVCQYSNIQIFVAELVGTFVLVVLATGTIVYDTQIGGTYGLWIAAAGPFVALLFGVYSFGKISLAHFNPAVTLAYYITGHITRIQIVWYVAAELIGAFLGSIFVMFVIGSESNIGANVINLDVAAHVVFPIEVLASAMLMAVICVVVYTKGLWRFGGVAIGGIVAIDILLFGAISGASMNPARALAPALLSGAIPDLWLYLTAPFVGTILVALLFKKRFAMQSVKKHT